MAAGTAGTNGRSWRAARMCFPGPLKRAPKGSIARDRTSRFETSTGAQDVGGLATNQSSGSEG